MELRKGKYYIVRYCYDDGSRFYYNVEKDEFNLPRSMATGFDTKYLAMPHLSKFRNDSHFSYSINFFDDYPNK